MNGYQRPSYTMCIILFNNIDKMPRLNAENRERSVGMLLAGLGVREVARRMGVSPATISNLQKRFQQTGTTKDIPR